VRFLERGRPPATLEVDAAGTVLVRPRAPGFATLVAAAGAAGPRELAVNLDADELGAPARATLAAGGRALAPPERRRPGSRRPPRTTLLALAVLVAAGEWIAWSRRWTA
jgi:hypothetical protein